MFKETKRKGFNFFRSYYDVYNELETDKDKVAFVDALLDRQFLGVKPTELKGMAKFAWISQVNSIDSQVKGYEDKTKTTLNDNFTPPTVGVNKKEITPTEQVQVEVQVKEKEQYVCHTHESFLLWFKECRNYINLEYNVKRLSAYDKQLFNELKEYTKEDFKKAFKNFSADKYYLDNNLIFPKHFLKEDNFIKYLNQPIKKELSIGEKLMGRTE